MFFYSIISMKRVSFVLLNRWNKKITFEYKVFVSPNISKLFISKYILGTQVNAIYINISPHLA